MTYANVEDRRAYAKAHYEKNKDRYNPARKQAADDAKFEALQKQRAEVRVKTAEAKKAAALKEKKLAKATAPVAKIPATFEGQLALILREHVAKELPRNLRCRNGAGSPLSAWMKGAGNDVDSKITAMQDGRVRYPYKTLGAGCEVLIDRIATRYELTFFQVGFLASYINRRYRGMVEYSHISRQIGIFGTEFFLLDGKHESIKACQDALEKACKKVSVSPYQLPLGAILDERATNIFLLIQLNTFLRFKTKQN